MRYSNQDFNYYDGTVSSSSNNLLYAFALAILVFAGALLVLQNLVPSTKASSVAPLVVESNKGIDEVGEKEAVVLGDVVHKGGKPVVEVADDGGTEDKDKVVKWKSNVDQHYYFVADSLPDKQKAADTLAEIYRREQYLLQALDEMTADGGKVVAADGVDITANMKRLVNKHYKKRTPFAELHSPNDKTVGSNSSKGELIEMCLRNKFDPKEWNPVNTIFRVHVHELSHSADKAYREDGDHGPVFNRIMNHLLQVSENLGIYDCAAYRASGRRYCGLLLSEEDTKCG